MENLLEYLNNISNEYLDELYLKVKNKDKNKTKIENVYNYLIDKMNKDIITLYDKDITSLSVQNNILKDTFIFCDKYRDNKEFIPSEADLLLKDYFNKKIDEVKLQKTIIDYININGLIEIKVLLRLLKETGFKATKKDIINVANKMNCFIKDDIIYIMEYFYKLNENNELINLKNEIPYRILTKEEVGNDNFNVSEVLNKLYNILENNMKLNNDVSLKIIYYLSITDDYKESINNELKKHNIELTSKEYKNLFNKLDSISLKLPKWLYNGFISSDDVVKENNRINLNSLKGKKKRNYYLYYYMIINGVLEIDKLIELLKENDIEISKEEVIKYFEEDEEFKIIDSYIYHNNLVDNDMGYVIKFEKKNNPYKIITDLGDIVNKIDNNYERLLKVTKKYDLKEDITNDLYLSIIYGTFNKYVLEDNLCYFKYNFSNKKIDVLYKELNDVSKDIISWKLNGYTKNEFSLLEIPKIKKIGRNEKCPCGSEKI